MPPAGYVYLAASSDALAPLVLRAHERLAKKRPRLAVSYAPVAGAPAAVCSMRAFVAKSFPDADVETFVLPGEVDPMSLDEARAIVARADMIFVCGGDPVLGAKIFAENGADAWLRDSRARGVPCIGVSAGSIMFGAMWVEWPDDPPPDAPHYGAILVPCAGVVGDLLVDCHDEADDWVELRIVGEMLRATKSQLRIRGIPTGAGLIVAPDGSLEIVGAPPFEIPL